MSQDLNNWLDSKTLFIISDVIVNLPKSSTTSSSLPEPSKASTKFSHSSSISLVILLTTYTLADISASNDASQHGKIDLIINDTVVADTENFPIYNGDFWNIYIGVSGSHNTSANINFGAYQSNWLKHVSSYTQSFEQSVTNRQKTFGADFGGSYKGGATGAQIFSQGGNKWKVEIIKGVPPKPRILKKIDNVSGNKLLSILKKHLGV